MDAVLPFRLHVKLFLCSKSVYKMFQMLPLNSRTDETINRDNRTCWMFTDAQFALKLCHFSPAAPDEPEI